MQSLYLVTVRRSNAIHASDTELVAHPPPAPEFLTIALPSQSAMIDTSV